MSHLVHPLKVVQLDGAEEQREKIGGKEIAVVSHERRGITSYHSLSGS